MSIQPQLITGPLSIGEILDKTFRLFKVHYWQLMLTATFYLIPIYILQTIWIFLNPSDSASDLGTDVFERVYLLLAQTYTSDDIPLGWMSSLAAICLNIALVVQVAKILHYEETTTWQNVQQGGRRFFGYLLLFILLILPLVGAVLIALLFVSTLPGYAAIFFTVPVVLVLIYFYVRWLVVVEAFLIEKTGKREALGRSHTLTEGYFWRSFLFLIVLQLLSSIISYVPLMTITFVSALISPVYPDSSIGIAINHSTLTFIAIILQPLGAIASVLYYFDLRVRQEGYDLQLRVQSQTEMVERQEESVIEQAV